MAPSALPSILPSGLPSSSPSSRPSNAPSSGPSAGPSVAPSAPPSPTPSVAPSATPSMKPTPEPTVKPTPADTPAPTSPPIECPSDEIPRQVVLQEFEDGTAEGWSNVVGKFRRSVDEGFTTFLGTFEEKDPRPTRIFKDLSRATARVLIQFDLYELDNWDGDNIKEGTDTLGVIIQGEVREVISFGHFKGDSDDEDLPARGETSSGITWTRTSVSRANSPQDCFLPPLETCPEGGYPDQIHNFVVTVPRGFFSTTVGVTIDWHLSGIRNEFVGFDNFRFMECTGPIPPTLPPTPIPTTAPPVPRPPTPRPPTPRPPPTCIPPGQECGECTPGLGCYHIGECCAGMCALGDTINECIEESECIPEYEECNDDGNDDRPCCDGATCIWSDHEDINQCVPDDEVNDGCIPEWEACHTDDGYDDKTCCNGATCVWDEDEDINECVPDGGYDNCVPEWEECHTDDGYDDKSCCGGATCHYGAEINACLPDGYWRQH